MKKKKQKTKIKYFKTIKKMKITKKLN